MCFPGDAMCCFQVGSQGGSGVTLHEVLVPHGRFPFGFQSTQEGHPKGHPPHKSKTNVPIFWSSFWSHNPKSMAPFPHFRSPLEQRGKRGAADLPGGRAAPRLRDHARRGLGEHRRGCGTGDAFAAPSRHVCELRTPN